MNEPVAVQHETHGYRYVCRHGKVLAMTVDDTTTTHRAVRHLAEFRGYIRRNGGHIDRVTIEECRTSDFGCNLCDAERKARKRK